MGVFWGNGGGGTLRGILGCNGGHEILKWGSSGWRYVTRRTCKTVQE